MLKLLKRARCESWRATAVAAIVSFAMGSFITARLTRPSPVRADEKHVFELNIYHAEPGKGPDLEAVWRDASKIVAKHRIKILGYWVPNEDPAWKDTFVYVAEFPSREEADRQWDELHKDPVFRPYIEAAKPFIAKVDRRFHVDEIYMRPSDFSDRH